MKIDIYVLRNTITKNKAGFFLVIPLSLSAFTHLWNPVGFPGIHLDEGHYMERAMYVLEGQGIHEESRYDHPYFGQLFLAGIFKIIGYPDSLKPVAGDVHSIMMLYLVPRLLMGIFAVVDTFLVFRIAQLRYNRKVALIASILFAVMPISLLTRWILLDSIQLPFILSSILFAIYANSSLCNNKKNILFILLSGTFLGLAIFTKFTAFTMIPLVGFLIISIGSPNKNNTNYDDANNIIGRIRRIKIRICDLKTLGLWFIPVILIPAIWPAHAVIIGESDKWLAGLIWQATGRSDKSIFSLAKSFLGMDPIFAILSAISFAYAAIKRDLLTLLWLFPYITFLFFIGYSAFFFLILLVPAFSISAARLLSDLLDRVKRKNIQLVLSFFTILVMGIFGLLPTTMLINTNVTSIHFNAISLLVNSILDNNDKYDSYNNNSYGLSSKPKLVTTIIVGNPKYHWIPKYVYHKNYYFKSFYSSTPVEIGKVILIVDKGFQDILARNESEHMLNIYNHTNKIATIVGIDFANYNQYPYTAIKWSGNRPDSQVEFRTNYQPNMKYSGINTDGKSDRNTLCSNYNNFKRTIYVCENFNGLITITPILINLTVLTMNLAHFFPLYIIGICRWTIWIFKRMCARLYVPIQATNCRDYPSLTIITAVYNEDSMLFKMALNSWEQNKPEELVAVIDESDKHCIEVFEEFSRNKSWTKMIITPNPGKRSALANGVREAKSQILALVDSDTIWAPDIKDKLLAPFHNDPNIGGVTTKNHPIERNTIWQKMIDFFWDMRNYCDLTSQTAMGQSLSCLTGRTSLYRRQIILSELDYFENEVILGVKKESGEDKCLTRILQKDNWKMYYQSNATVFSAAAIDFKTFWKQRIRWARNSYNSDLVSLSHRWIWKYPFLTFHMIDRFISVFTIFLGPIFIAFSIYETNWIITFSILCLWVVGRGIRNMDHFKRRPADMLMLPIFIAVNFLIALAKLYALVTIREQKTIRQLNEMHDENDNNAKGFFQKCVTIGATAMILCVLAFFIILTR